ncbi:hypothetical protein [Actinoplanes sp. NPDC049802]|uniref:hypothetical protein n=1 Tax=Actinoplanes sp. NPDC049802 TaxID=3154742 RepID=UPI0033CD0DF6
MIQTTLPAMLPCQQPTRRLSSHQVVGPTGRGHADEEVGRAELVQIMIWSTGEAELETVRLRDDRIVNKHFDLTGRSNLDDLLDQLVRLLVCNEVPEEAIAADLVSLGCELLGAASTG